MITFPNKTQNDLCDQSLDTKERQSHHISNTFNNSSAVADIKGRICHFVKWQKRPFGVIGTTIAQSLLLADRTVHFCDTGGNNYIFVFFGIDFT